MGSFKFFLIKLKNSYIFDISSLVFLKQSEYLYIIYYISKMSTEQSSFRDMFEYPHNSGSPNGLSIHYPGRRLKKANTEQKPRNRQSFAGIVLKTKNVVLFTSKLKDRIARKGAFNQHTLKPSQLSFLQSEIQSQQINAYFFHDNRIIFGLEIFYLFVMVMYLWKCTVQIVLGKINDYEIINCLAFMFVVLHTLLFNATEYQNQKQELIKDRRKIFAIYKDKKLVADLIIILVLALQILPLDNLNWLFVSTRLLALILCIQVSNTNSKIQKQISVSNQTEVFLSILKLLFKVFLFLHVLSLLLNLMARIQQEQGISQIWLTSNKLSYSSDLQKYVIGWYWGATILCTVGFGDIVPANNYERFFISIVEVTCCLAFGYFVTVIGSLIKMRAEPEEHYEKDVRSLNRCLSFLSITNDLKRKIRTHYFNKHIIQKIYDPNQQNLILQNLTPNLKTSVLEQNNISILKKSQSLKRFSNEVLTNLTQVLKRVIFAPEHVLYSRNTKERKIWFIQSGQVEQFTNNFDQSCLQKMISVYNDKEDITVGWINFIANSAYRTICKAKIFTVAYQLEFMNFQTIIKEDVHEYRRFLQIQQLMLQNQRRYTHKCLSCERYTHNVIDCPRIHFMKKDTKTLIDQVNNLSKYKSGQRKKKKMQRNNMNYNWKKIYGTGKLQLQAKNLIHQDQGRNSIGMIQNFLNIVSRNSVKKIDNRRMSYLPNRHGSKKQLGNIKHQRESVDKSILTDCINEELSQYQEEESELDQVFDMVFFNKDQKDYMVDHDVQVVLTAYARESARKKNHDLTKPSRIQQ